MTALYSISDVIDATGGRVSGVRCHEVTSISIDSREIEPGALFVAIKGENFDGHDFVAAAIEAGAAAALVSSERAETLADLPLIVVPDALAGLYDIARFNRSRSGAKIVGVTGSVGKTSTKEAIRVALEASGRTHASIKSFNNHWGVPLMLARMPQDASFGVFELGMSSAGEIGPLATLVRPHVALITTIAPAHIEFFDSIEGIARAKAEIFEGLEAGSIAILGCDHDQADLLRQLAREAGMTARFYGFDAGAEIKIAGYQLSAPGATARVSGLRGVKNVRVAAPGRHVVANAVAALAVTEALGGDVEAANRALRSHAAPEGRGATFLLGSEDLPLYLVDESYNANPASMRAALDVFAHTPAATGRRFVVLGDMRELGADAARYHEQLRDSILAANPDGVFLVGPHMAALAAVLPSSLVSGQSQAVDAIIPLVLATLAQGDSVMIKGSNGLKLGSLVARIRAQFGANK